MEDKGFMRFEDMQEDHLRTLMPFRGTDSRGIPVNLTIEEAQVVARLRFLCGCGYGSMTIHVHQGRRAGVDTILKDK